MKKSTLLIPALAAMFIAYAASATGTTDNSSQSNAESSSSSSSEANDSSSDEKNAEQLAIVLAIDADVEYGAYLGGECLTCHTPTAGDGSIPLIHAKDKDFIASALLEYKNQQRENEVMRGVTAALSNEEIAALATYFSTQ